MLLQPAAHKGIAQPSSLRAPSWVQEQLRLLQIIEVMVQTIRQHVDPSSREPVLDNTIPIPTQAFSPGLFPKASTFRKVPDITEWKVQENIYAQTIDETLASLRALLSFLPLSTVQGQQSSAPSFPPATGALDDCKNSPSTPGIQPSQHSKLSETMTNDPTSTAAHTDQHAGLLYGDKLGGPAGKYLDSEKSEKELSSICKDVESLITKLERSFGFSGGHNTQAVTQVGSANETSSGQVPSQIRQERFPSDITNHSNFGQSRWNSIASTRLHVNGAPIPHSGLPNDFLATPVKIPSLHVEDHQSVTHKNT